MNWDDKLDDDEIEYVRLNMKSLADIYYDPSSEDQGYASFVSSYGDYMFFPGDDTDYVEWEVVSRCLELTAEFTPYPIYHGNGKLINSIRDFSKILEEGGIHFGVVMMGRDVILSFVGMLLDEEDSFVEMFGFEDSSSLQLEAAIVINKTFIQHVIDVFSSLTEWTMLSKIQSTVHLLVSDSAEIREAGARVIRALSESSPTCRDIMGNAGVYSTLLRYAL